MAYGSNAVPSQSIQFLFEFNFVLGATELLVKRVLLEIKAMARPEGDGSHKHLITDCRIPFKRSKSN